MRTKNTFACCLCESSLAKLLCRSLFFSILQNSYSFGRGGERPSFSVVNVVFVALAVGILSPTLLFLNFNNKTIFVL